MYRFIFVVLIILIGCQQEIPPSAEALSEADIDQVKEEILEINAAIKEGFLHSDISLYESLISFDRHRTVINGKVYWSADDYLEMVRPFMETKESDRPESIIEDIRSEIQVLSKTTALVIENIKQIDKDNEGSVVMEAEMVVTGLWVKVGDEWKIMYTHQSNKIEENSDNG